MDVCNPNRFRFSLANLMLATVPLAIACLFSAPLMRYDLWVGAIPILVIGLSTGIGAMRHGVVGLWPGLVRGCFVVLFLLGTLSYIAMLFA
jgi:hypothetical protein